MLSLDLFDSKYERELREGAVDDLEYRRMNDLREKMEYLMQAYKKADTDEMRQAIMARYNEYKAEREGYMKVREQQVPSRQDPFAYVKPEPKGIGDIQDPKQKMAQLQQRSKKGPLANVAAGIKAFVKGEPEPMGEADNPLDQLPLPSQTRPTPRFGTRTHAQNVYFEILKAWDDERDYIVIPFPNAPNPVTMIRGQLWNAIVDLGSIKDPKRRAKYVEERFNDFESFMSWLGNLKRYKVPAKKKGKTQSLPLQIPQQPTGQAQPTAPGSPLMDPEFTGIKPPGNLQEKKKSSDLDAKDVGLSRELQKARARFPAAASDLEAGILDQMDQQQQAQQALAQQQADLNRQDQQIAGLAQVNQQQDGVMRAQGQEIDRLTQRLQQVMTQPTAAPATAPVTPQVEPAAPDAAPAPDMVYVPDVPADTATQDREIARLDKQIQQLELMMALKTPAERSDLEDRIRDLEKARGEQEEKKRATAKKSAATRQRKKQATTIDMEPTQAQLGFGASGQPLDPSAMIAGKKLKSDQGATPKSAKAKARAVIAKAAQTSQPQAVTLEGQPQELINRYLAINAETDVDAVRKAIQAISRDSTLSATSKSRLLGQIGMIIQRHRLPIGRSYYQFMQQYMEEQTVSETVDDVRAGMAKIYRRLAPKIERHRDSFLAGQLYDELENYAELHGAEGEFKRMMATARNSAHMEYDTNPGGFQNWFWFLPFEDEQLEEAIPTIRGIPKAQLSADYTGEDLVRDANALFTAGGFKLADKEVEPRVDNPKKINTTYYWRKKIKGLTPDQGQVQQLMIEIYNYAPNRTYWAINDWANDGARVTPDLAQKLWRRMERTIKDSIDTAERENYWYSMTGNGKKPKDLEEEGVAEGFTDTLKSVWREIKTYVVDFVANAVGLPDDQRREVFVKAGNTFSNEVIKLLANHPARDKLIPMVREIGGYMAKARTLQELNSLMDKAELFLADVDAGKFDPPSRVAKTLPRFDDRQDMKENTDDIKKRMSKLEALALAANRAGDDAKCKRYQEKIQAIKQKLSQSMAEGWSDQGNPTAYSVYIDGREWRAYKSDEQARRVAEKVQANLKLQGREQTVTIAPSRTKQVQEDFGMPGTTIPRKSVIQGYTVYFNPKTQVVSVTRGGDSEEAAIEQQKLSVASMKNFRQAADRLIDKIESDLNEAKEIKTREDFIKERDRLLRMIGQETNPANKQIIKAEIRKLESQAEAEGWITMQQRMVREDSDSREAVEMAIMRRMLVAHTDLIMRHGLDGVVAAIEEVAEDVGEVDEIGTSDVSAYVRRVQGILEPDNEV